MAFTYLASPYSDSDPAVRLGRYLEAMRCAAWMLKQKLWVYSPIAHCHQMAVDYTLPTDFGFWSDYNRAMLETAKDMAVLQIPGWDRSAGVTGETEIAKCRGLFVGFIRPLPGGGYHRELDVK